MDINNSRYIFFLHEKYVKKNGFDSYSKGPRDIILHYDLKYGELADNMKAPTPFTADRWKTICTSINNDICNIFKLQLPPFEMYIAAFLLAFRKDYKNAIILFRRCQTLLPKTIYGQINFVFMNLQIAQLLERLGKNRQALSVLINTRALIHHDNKLFNQIHNFYASCCVSIGILCYREIKAPQIATSCFLTSTLIRSKYESTYTPSVYKHYIAHAYRFAGMMPCLTPTAAYAYMKEAYCLRTELYKGFSDDVTNEEMFHMETDFIIFLIRNHFKTGLINLHSKSLLRLIAALSPQLRNHLSPNINNIATTLYRYYSILHVGRKSTLWKRMANRSTY